MDISKDDLHEDQIMDRLEAIIDPELGIDLVNLGLIYGIKCEGPKALVTMTLTTIGCPLSEWLDDEIRRAVVTVPDIDQCEIKLVWEPAWDVSKMSRYARMALGIHG